MDAFRLDSTIAIRSLLRRPAFTAVAITTLALAMGATTALFSVIEGVLLHPIPYRDSDRIVSVWVTPRDKPQPNDFGSVSHLNFLDWQRRATSFEDLALYSSATFIVTGTGEPAVVPGAVVTPDFFKVFGVTLARGRGFTPAEDVVHGPAVAVVSEGFWKEQLGGRPDVVGTTVEISSRPYEIVGVAPSGFAFPPAARLWRPVQNDDQACGRDCVYLNAVGRLKAGVTVASARREMQAIAAGLEQAFPAANHNSAIGLATLQDEIVGDVRPALVILLGAVFLVLLIACANVANLLLVRGATRQSEMAVRVALGAGRARLVRLLLTESLILAAAAAAAGLLLGAWGIGALKAVAPVGIPRLGDVRFDATTFAFALAIAVVTTALFGLGPAAHAVATPPAALLGGRTDVSGRRTRWSRSGLLVAEVALSLVLLVGAGALVRSLMRLQAIEPGFKPDGLTVFTLALPPARYPQSQDVIRTYESISAQLGAIPGVQSVASVSGLPLSGAENVFNFARTDRPAPTPGTAPSALFLVVDANYFRTFGIPLVAGRAFVEADRDNAPPVIVISRRMAEQYWPGEDPVGRTVQLSNGTTPKLIVGVAGDVRSTELTESPRPEMYVPEAQTGTRALGFALRSSLPPGQLLAAARDVVHHVDAKLPVIRPGTEAALVDRQLVRPRFYMLLLGLFAGLAVALAAVGIYGVVAYAVAQRRREIGVRMALGADAGEVVRLVMGDGLRPVALGLAIGTAAALAAGRLLARLLYEVGPTDPAAMAAVLAGLLVIAAVACLIPARRATRIAPADALRGD